MGESERIQQTIKWISCKERLPETGGDYLVIVRQKYDWEKEWNYGIDLATTFGDYIDNFWNTCNDWCEGQETHIDYWAELELPELGDDIDE